MSAHKKAGPAEILRAVQKDESFLEYLKSRVTEIIKITIGTQYWLRYHKTVDLFCEILYYGATTISLRQTLGEEYTGILQFDKESGKLPSYIARILMVVLQCGGPFAIRQLFNKFENSLKSGVLSTYLRPEIKLFLLHQIPLLKSFPSFFLRLHLASFYLNGNFYHFSKRLTKINYVLVRNFFVDYSVRNSFRVIGIVLTVNIALSICYSLYKVGKKMKIKENLDSVSDSYTEPSKRCSLCLGPRKFPSVTPCGHMFCWHCIHEWLQNSSICPICRHLSTSPEIVPLINYL